jgi:hypothetical protein
MDVNRWAVDVGGPRVAVWGAWVKWTDYKKLRSKTERLQRQLDAANALINDLFEQVASHEP